MSILSENKHQMNDRTLVEAIKDWESIKFKQALKFMTQKWYGKLKDFCAYEDMDDVFAEGIMLLRMNIHQFNFDATLETYFITICRNLYFQKQRKKTEAQTTYLADLSEILPYKVLTKARENNKEEFDKLMQYSFNLLKGQCQKVLKLLYITADNFTISEELGYQDKQSASKTIYRCKEVWKKAVNEDKALRNKLVEFI